MVKTQQLLPDEQKRYDKIIEIKKEWGKELLILSHHYQREEIARIGDRLGDSFELAKVASQAEDARYILYCGVRFMAEAAEVVRRDEQIVIHPDPDSGCPLADFAPTDKAQQAWNALTEIRGPEAIMPLVYMNSSAAIKAKVGLWGGSVCTSSNASKAFDWALDSREALFFFPDEHLGRNTSNLKGIPSEQIVLWDPEQNQGGLSEDQIKLAKVFLWKGCCHVHTAFTLDDINQIRKDYPHGRILVHPECPEEIVNNADGAGSTAYLVNEVAKAKPGETLVIGTEINLVSRLAHTYHDRMSFRSEARNLFHSMGALRFLLSVEMTAIYIFNRST
jgi:quinolinate synthase